MEKKEIERITELVKGKKICLILLFAIMCVFIFNCVFGILAIIHKNIVDVVINFLFMGVELDFIVGLIYFNFKFQAEIKDFIGDVIEDYKQKEEKPARKYTKK